jgi:hypothetical protein
VSRGGPSIPTSAAPSPPDISRSAESSRSGATYEAFAALEQTPPPGQLRIAASRYAPEYFPATIHWRNEADALEAVEPGEWHSVTFDVVTVTESPVDKGGSIAWVPEYECDLEAIAPAAGI